MLHLSEIDIRTLEHSRRLNDANRYGWLRTSARRVGPTMSLGAVLGAIGARLAPIALIRENPGTQSGVEDPTKGSAVRSLA